MKFLTTIDTMNHTELLELVRKIPDYPKEGILFYDITTALQDPAGLRAIIQGMLAHCQGLQIDKVIGTEARGFIFAPTVAYELGAGFVPVRKPNKLPFERMGYDYDLEYGTDRLEIHIDAIKAGENVLIVDDLLATGGTAHAVTELVKQMGGNVVGLSFLIELDGLGGREKLAGYHCQSILTVPA
jgi:adenine phosphoribosyltransferase